MIDRSDKNTSVVENVAYLLLVMFCLTLFSGGRDEVHDESANRRIRQPSYLTYLHQREKYRHGNEFRTFSTCLR